MSSDIEQNHGGQLTEIVRGLTRRSASNHLPHRVTEAINRQDEASEVLIKLIQLTLVTIFGILYFFARKTDAGTAFSPVPYALGAYFLLTTIGLAWAMTRRVPDWAVYISIIFDIGLLLTLIWSFHIQYDQPPSFFLKAPTMLYIFIFIAIRALRFQPRFVAAAGFVAMLGWLAMVAYVVMIDPENTMITRSYVTYLTSNSILIGAEIDKVIAVAMVTAILFLALTRGQSLLIQATTEQAAAQDLSRFFDRSVADQITTSDDQIAAGEGKLRTAAILNVDIRNFTPMAATMTPDELMSVLAEYQSLIVPIVQDNHGTIDKFLGDGIMASFGAATDSDTHAADALRAIDGIIAAHAQWQKERIDKGLNAFEINASVADGEIVFGAVGGSGRLEYTVIGGPVNLSAKLEKHNKTLKTKAITTASCMALARKQGYRPGRKDRKVTGKVDGVKGRQSLIVMHD